MGKTIYLVLDMQNDLVHAEGPSGKGPLGEQVRERGIIARTSRAVQRARAAGALVGFVRVGFSSHYQECPRHSPVFSGAPAAGLFKLGEWGTAIHPDIEVNGDDLQILKDEQIKLRQYGFCLLRNAVARIKTYKQLYYYGVYQDRR